MIAGLAVAARTKNNLVDLIRPARLYSCFLTPPVALALFYQPRNTFRVSHLRIRFVSTGFSKVPSRTEFNMVARTTRAAKSAAPAVSAVKKEPTTTTASTRKRKVKEEPDADAVQPELKAVKKEDTDTDAPLHVVTKAPPEEEGDTKKKDRKASNLSDKKWAAYVQASISGPFPGFAYPTHEEAEKVAYLLAEWHGYKRDAKTGQAQLPRHRKPTSNDFAGGCGNVPNVLDALIRTVLSCNTSNRNSSAAHRSMVARFGDCNWQAILDAPHQDLVDSIKCGGLANNKGKTIRGILEETQRRHGILSLDHLHAPGTSDEVIMKELLTFPGVGPKVATCVSMFCIGRQTMAVDTHVWRLSKMLGWVPESATRDQTCYHLEERLPPHLKYPLHVLLIKHGKRCKSCSARGFANAGDDDPSSEQENSDVEEDLGEDESMIKSEAGASPTKVKQEAKEKAKNCPLRQHGLVHKRTYSKKAAAAAAVKKEEGGEDVKPQVKKEEAVDVKSEKPSPSKKIKTEKDAKDAPQKGTARRTSSRGAKAVKAEA